MSPENLQKLIKCSCPRHPSELAGDLDENREVSECLCKLCQLLQYCLETNGRQFQKGQYHLASLGGNGTSNSFLQRLRPDIAPAIFIILLGAPDNTDSDPWLWEVFLARI